MQKRLSGILMVLILFNTLLFKISYAEDSVQKKAVDVVCGIGLMENVEEVNFYPESGITRGEMAKIIAGIFNENKDFSNAWSSHYFKDESAELSEKDLTDIAEKGIFTDVDAENEYFYDVNTVYAKGIMVGISHNEFGVNNMITGEQAVKTIVHLLGYSYQAENMGGYPNGYISIAYKLDLIKNADNLNKNITRGELAEILYNALEVDINQVHFENPIYIGVDENATFLTEVLKLKKYEGRMTDNGYSGVSGIENSVKNQIIVDGEIFFMSEKDEYICDYLGRNVEVYYNEDYEVVYVSKADDEEEITFDVKDFIDYSKDNITYFDGKRERNISLDEDCTYMIKNGTGVTSYTKADFEFSEGTIAVVTRKGSQKADLIYINNYKTIMVDYIDTENQCIYGNTNANEKITLEGQDKYIVIYNKNEKKSDISTIKSGDLITVFESEKAITIYTKYEIISDFKVSSVIRDDYDRTKISGEKELELSREYKGDLPKTGNIYIIYIDAFGKAAHIEIAAGEDLYGVYVRVIKNEEETELTAKIYTADGKLQNIKLSERVKLCYDDNNKTYEKSYKISNVKDYNAVINILSGYCGYKSDSSISGGIIRYRTNEQGEIFYIEMPSVQKIYDNKENRLVSIYTGETAMYYKPGQGFGGRIITDTNTVVFEIDPEKIGEDNAFAVKDSNVFLNNATYNTAKSVFITAFTTKKDSSVASYILFEAEPKTSVDPTDSGYAVVENVTQGIDEDEEPCYIIDCYVKGKTRIRFFADFDVYDKIVNAQGEEKDFLTGKYFTLKKGDIFRYIADNRCNLTYIFLMYDAEAVNPASGGVGNIPGSLGVWKADADGKFRHTNPMAIDDANAVIESKEAVMNNSTGRLRITACSPVKLEDNKYLTTTTCDLNVFGLSTAYSETGVYRTDNWIAKNIVIVEKEKKAVNIREGQVSDIRTFEEVGKDCDKIVAISVYQEPIGFVVYKNF